MRTFGRRAGSNVRGYVKVDFGRPDIMTWRYWNALDHGFIPTRYKLAAKSPQERIARLEAPLPLLDAPQRVLLWPDIVMLETLPIVVNADELSADVIGALRGQKEREGNLLLRRHATGDADLLGFFDLPPAGALFARMQDFVGHVGVATPRREAVHLH